MWWCRSNAASLWSASTGRLPVTSDCTTPLARRTAPSGSPAHPPARGPAWAAPGGPVPPASRERGEEPLHLLVRVLDAVGRQELAGERALGAAGERRQVRQRHADHVGQRVGVPASADARSSRRGSGRCPTARAFSPRHRDTWHRQPVAGPEIQHRLTHVAGQAYRRALNSTFDELEGDDAQPDPTVAVGLRPGGGGGRHGARLSHLRRAGHRRAATTCPLAVASPPDATALARPPAGSRARAATPSTGRSPTRARARELLTDKEVYGILELAAARRAAQLTIVTSGAVNPQGTQVAAAGADRRRAGARRRARPAEPSRSRRRRWRRSPGERRRPHRAAGRERAAVDRRRWSPPWRSGCSWSGAGARAGVTAHARRCRSACSPPARSPGC